MNTILLRTGIILSVLLLLSFHGFNQSREHTAWLAATNTTKLSNHFSTFLDLQVRGSSKVDYVKNVIIRPGLTYNFNSKYALTLGYMYVPTYNQVEGLETTRLDEQRIWQQFVINYRLGNTRLTHRFRLEQRFIEQTAGEVFSQRGRYMARALFPIQADTLFESGPYAAIQEEVFLNLQNKEKLNNKLFDQNRTYVGLGYRFGKKLDIEGGYLWQYVKGSVRDRHAHIAQLSFISRF